MTTERLVAAGREFRLVGGVWKELGLGEASPDKQIDLAAGGVLPEELKELARRSGTYRLVIDAQVVEVVIPEHGAGMP